MSAFIPSKKHIDALVTKAIGRDSYCSVEIDGESTRVTLCEADFVGQMLVDQVVKAVGIRYPEDLTDLPGPTDAYYKLPYTFERVMVAKNLRHGVGTAHERTYDKPLDALDIIKMIQCYEYQACEDPEFDQSPAKELLGQLLSAMTHALPGYSDAVYSLNN